MRSIVLSMAPDDVEAVLDIVLPMAPLGVHMRERPGESELILHGENAALFAPDAFADRCGPLVRRVEAGEAPDDWRVRRQSIYEPLTIAEWLVVRPEWAPPAPPGSLEVILAEGAGFGSGAHPTTRACLELIAAAPPGESLADLGCGSGVLAIAAARLGWRRVHAVDRSAASVDAVRTNAALNQVELTVTQADLASYAPPTAEVVVANVPRGAHGAIAKRLTEAPRKLIATGVTPADAEEVVAGYAAIGLRPEQCWNAADWTVLTLAGER